MRVTSVLLASLATILSPWACAQILPQTITFEDRTAGSGVGFRHVAGKTAQKYLPEAMGSGVAILDFDGDGRLDLFFVNGMELREGLKEPPVTKSQKECHRLYRNEGGWRFRDVTAEWGICGEGYGMGVAVGDVNGDGRPDLFITTVGRGYLYRNTGKGFVREQVLGDGWQAGAAFLDYDGDGDQDLFVSRYLDWTFAGSRWCGEENLRAYCHPRQFRAVPHLLFRNEAGRFIDVSAETGIAARPGKGLGVRIDDVNADGWPDVLVANDSVAQQLFLNRAGKRFEEMALRYGMAYGEDGEAYAGMGIDTADVDGDGRPDVLVNALARQGYWLYRQTEAGRYEPASGRSGMAAITGMHSGWGMRLADFDNDGWPDLIAAQGHVMDTIEASDPGVKHLEPPLLVRNLFGRFYDVGADAGPAFRQARAGRGLAAGDLDGDGLLDAVITHNDGSPVLLRNTTATGNGWLAVRLPRPGRVEIFTRDGRRMTGYSGGSGSYLSWSPAALHFGLGPEDRAMKVEIAWPGGGRCVWEGDVVDRVLVLDRNCEER